MTQDTERLRVFEAVSLLEQCGIQPPMTRKTHGPFRIDPTQWLCNEVEAGRLVFHDYTGLKIEPGAYLGHFGLYDETTNIAQLNTWLASIGHLRRIPETACVPTAAVILERHDEDSRPVFRMPLCPAEVPAELLALPADTFVVCVEESGSMRGAHYTTAAKLADYIRGRLPAGVPADAPEPASAPAVAAAAPAQASSASVPTVADRESVAPSTEAVPDAGIVRHKLKSTRRNPLDAVYARAKREATDPTCPHSVWAALVAMATGSNPPRELGEYRRTTEVIRATGARGGWLKKSAFMDKWRNDAKRVKQS